MKDIKIRNINIKSESEFDLVTNRCMETILETIPEFDNNPEKDDLKFNNILIDKKSADLLKGSEVDYVSELIGNSFKISNPQTKSSCGCGVSFSL